MANPNETQQKDINKDTNRNRGERPTKDPRQDRKEMPGAKKPIDDDYPPMKVGAAPTEEPEEVEEDEEKDTEDTGLRSKPSDLGKGTFGGKPYGKKDQPGNNDRGGFGSGTGGKSGGQSKKDSSGSGQQMAYGDDEDEDK